MTNTPSAAQMAALLAQWNDWLGARTDVMLSLEDRVRTAGTDQDRADLAEAFMARKVVDDRLQAVTELAEHDRAEAADLAGQPLVDDLGQRVGQNLSDAAALVDAIVQRVDQRVSSVETQSVIEVTAATSADTDLSVAEGLAQALGSHVNEAAQLRGELVARRGLVDLAGRAAELRSELEQIDAERRQLLEKWAASAAHLEALGEIEAAVRQLAERCRAKVVQAPTLAIPSVAAVGPLATTEELDALPWAAARRVMIPVLDKIERLGAALAVARHRYQQPLDDRDDLRGLLQSFRDKAAAHDLGENSDLEPLYRRAEAYLWAAPCDLAAARPLVDRYVAAVNALISTEVASSDAAPDRLAPERNGS